MPAALSTSALFLVCYIVYHAQVGSVRFTRQGFVRPVYFTILVTHVTLAATVRTRVLAASAATLDRMLRPTRASVSGRRVRRRAAHELQRRQRLHRRQLRSGDRVRARVQ